MLVLSGRCQHYKKGAALASYNLVLVARLCLFAPVACFFAKKQATGGEVTRANAFTQDFKERSENAGRLTLSHRLLSL